MRLDDFNVSSIKTAIKSLIKNPFSLQVNYSVPISTPKYKNLQCCTMVLFLARIQKIVLVGYYWRVFYCMYNQ